MPSKDILDTERADYTAMLFMYAYGDHPDLREKRVIAHHRPTDAIAMLIEGQLYERIEEDFIIKVKPLFDQYEITLEEIPLQHITA